MGKFGYLSMKTDEAATDLIASDFKDLGHAAQKLANHAIMLGGLGIGTTIFKWIAFVAAVYLLILDRTNWRTNMLTALLIPYIFLSLPSILFHLFRGEVGKWIAFIAVILRLFFPQHAPGTHPGIWRVQKLLHKKPWNFQHCGNNHSSGISSLGTYYSLPMNVCFKYMHLVK